MPSVTLTDLEAAWDELHDAKPDGWFVGTPVYVEHRRACEHVPGRHHSTAQAGARFA